MTKKIVITGGLGYIGTELCKLYSGTSRKDKIVVLDNRFVSERVKQLRDWGIEFYQGDILDTEFLNRHLKDADIVHHLAGITDVAYTKTESTPEKDAQIKQAAVVGTNNVLKAISNTCKIVFPSTHVVYEGYNEALYNLTEDTPVKPVLTYSLCKSLNEKAILASGKDYVILRLASVYGYSTDTMRIGIMPNLFSKIASQNGTIKLFGRGQQLKSLVPLLDVARCFKFMEESSIKNEVFHVSQESVTVKEVAELCKEIHSHVSLVETDDEIPNKGYTLSNEKLLKTGFEFLYKLKPALEEMINNWSSKNISEELEYKIKGSKPYIDKRGKILNYELPEPINLIGFITSEPYTTRANHVHPVQEQKVLLVDGQYVSVFQDLLTPNAPKITQVVNPGDIIVTKPNVAHTMVFNKKSTLLNLVRGEREHENYGITHTLPHVLVTQEDIRTLLSGYKFECRSCGNTELERVISMGYQPLANNLLDSVAEKEEVFPLEMNYCPECHNCQLSYVVPPEKMFSNYLYKSSTAAPLRAHFEQAADNYIQELGLVKNSTVIDVGSNDGVGLLPFKHRGIDNLIGIEPATNLAELTNKQGIKTLNKFLNLEVVINNNLTKSADLVLASNVFAHIDNISETAKACLRMLKDNGTFVIEVQYLLNTLQDLTFDNIYHEHVNYWSVLSLDKFFSKLGATLYKVERINTHGGSLRAYIRNGITEKTSSVTNLIEEEVRAGLTDFQTYRTFAKSVENLKSQVLANLNNIDNVIGFGAPAKATTMLNYFGIRDKIKYIIEDNELKQGKYVPGVKIPIVSRNEITDKPEHILVLAWNYFEAIKEANKDLGDIFISIKDLETETVWNRGDTKKEIWY